MHLALWLCAQLKQHSIWAPFGPHLGPIWAPFGPQSGPTGAQSGLLLGKCAPIGVWVYTKMCTWQFGCVPKYAPTAVWAYTKMCTRQFGSVPIYALKIFWPVSKCAPRALVFYMSLKSLHESYLPVSVG